jgi:hypothetical protein
MSNTTVYLVVKNLSGVVDDFIVPLANGRNAGISTFTKLNSGDTWGRLKQSFEESSAEKGRGSEIIRLKDGVEYWILPFTVHPEMAQPAIPEDAFVLDKASYVSYDWDVDGEELV